MLEISEIIAQAQQKGASDIHIVTGLPVKCRIDGKVQNLTEKVLTWEDCEYYAKCLAGDLFHEIECIGELDLARTFPCGARTRINLFRQQGAVSAAIRILADTIPEIEALNLPPVVSEFPEYRSGIILVTGETGSGKSTTLAAILNRINHTRRSHIITLEDPIEYIYEPDQCIINQREIGKDTRSYADGLRSILREDPDVILIGEMRDYETISLAMTAAETGHLVFGTLHTSSAAQTVDRIIDACPIHSQDQVRSQLASMIQGIIAQTLIPRADGKGRVAAVEVMIGTDAIRNLIRSAKINMMETTMAAGARDGMCTLNASLANLYKTGQISYETALEYATDRGEMEKKLLSGI